MSLYLKCFLFVLFPFYLMSIDIAITIDDYPSSNGQIFSTQEQTYAILRACSKHDCKVTFFCVGENCKKLGSNFLSLVDEQGHFLANHSMTHPHFSNQSLKEWELEIKQVEKILKPYKNMRKWFRYPFLDYGDRSSLGGSAKKTTQSLKRLQELGYSEGYVTINTFDWHINQKLQKCLKEKKSVNYIALKNLYLNLLKEWILYYIHLYESKVSEKITHTLILHANDLNALYLEDILTMIKDSKWNIVSPEIAFENTQWRKKIQVLSLILNKPYSLDGKEIDKLLDGAKVFGEIDPSSEVKKEANLLQNP